MTRRAVAFEYAAQPHHVVFRAGAVDDLPALLPDRGFDKPVFFASPRWRQTVERLVDHPNQAGDRVFDTVEQHVPRAVVDQALSFLDGTSAGCVVCIGGGSTIGLGKAVAVETGLDVVAVPTTYSGSEMTPTFGITAEGRKQSGSSPAALPKLVVYDPRLMAQLPTKVAGASALNALAHAVEGLYAPASNPISTVVAERAVRLIADALPAVIAAPDDPGAHEELTLGACLAGLTLANAGMSFHHKVCHVLGGTFGMPHAETHAALLPHSVALLRSLEPAAHARLATVLDGEPEQRVFELLTAAVQPSDLASRGLSPQVVEAAVGPVIERVRPLYDLEPDDVRRLLANAAQGTAP